MTKEDLGLEVSPNRLLPTTRERVGLVVDGANAASAVKTIVAAEACWSAADMDGTATFGARHTNYTISSEQQRHPQYA